MKKIVSISEKQWKVSETKAIKNEPSTTNLSSSLWPASKIILN